ncbi:peptidoglycan editing factor PgeF [Helicobacter rodentium]|uniref:peptidoglycan editing factor PgeF n=1 Tax=Helicobacter rodentium TaxID=59617 RepID=UPI0006903811|nr:peptidoglycan editing factor PgeF [Helicobacter rodentium]
MIDSASPLIEHISTPDGIKAFLSCAPLNIAFHAGGDSKVTIEQNRSLCIAPLPLSSLAYLNQIHSQEVLQANQGGLLGNGDGILIAQKNIIGLIMVADCNPILLFDPKHNVLALLHGGRVGLQKGIIPNALKQMQEKFNTNTSDLFAYVGPSIRACCYEVGEEIFSDCFFETGKILQQGKIFLDLTAIILKQFQEANITNYTFSPHCTCCSSAYFSYRRDQKCGRFGLFASLT